MSIRIRAAWAALAASGILAACSDTTAPAPSSADSSPHAALAAPGATVDFSTTTTIALVGSATFPRAIGKAVFKFGTKRRELDLEVEHTKRLAGRTVFFYLGGAKIGQATVDALGVANMVLDTQLGDAVPQSVTGQLVEVKKRTGVLIASGSF